MSSLSLQASARLWDADGLREHQPLQDSPLCPETGFGGRTAGGESRERGIITLKSCWPLQRGNGGFVTNFYGVQL